MTQEKTQDKEEVGAFEQKLEKLNLKVSNLQDFIEAIFN